MHSGNRAASSGTTGAGNPVTETMGAMISIFASTLAAAALAGNLHTIVLQSGDRLPVRDEVRVEDALVIFRAAGGPLYSIRISEIDLAGTERVNTTGTMDTRPTGPRRSPDQARADLEKMFEGRSLSNRAIVVSEDEKQRIIEEASRSRGVPVPLPELPSMSSVATPPGERPAAAGSRDEWYWRERARSFEDRVRLAKEELALLVHKERRLQDEILGLLSLGYNPNQFNLQVLQLAHTRDSLPRAQLQVERAERDLARFRDDARRQGILPGWLR
jgi:hypothetical protein